MKARHPNILQYFRKSISPPTLLDGFSNSKAKINYALWKVVLNEQFCCKFENCPNQHLSCHIMYAQGTATWPRSPGQPHLMETQLLPDHFLLGQHLTPPASSSPPSNLYSPWHLVFTSSTRMLLSLCPSMDPIIIHCRLYRYPVTARFTYPA